MEREVKRLRSEKEKVFRLGNGRYRRRIFPFAVHYRDPDTGLYEEMNSLLKKSETGYVTTDGNAEITFSADGTNGNTVTIHAPEGSVSMSFAGKHRSHGGRRKNNPFPQMKTPYGLGKPEDGKHPMICFDRCTEEADLVYETCRDGLKERLLLSDPCESYAFDFELGTDGYLLKADSDRNKLCVRRRTDGKTVYEMPAPRMEDAGGAASDRIRMQLRQRKRGKYVLTLTADRDWLNAPEREFPVTVQSSLFKVTCVASGGSGCSCDDGCGGCTTSPTTKDNCPSDCCCPTPSKKENVIHNVGNTGTVGVSGDGSVYKYSFPLSYHEFAQTGADEGIALFFLTDAEADAPIVITTEYRDPETGEFVTGEILPVFIQEEGFAYIMLSGEKLWDWELRNLEVRITVSPDPAFASSDVSYPFHFSFDYAGAEQFEQYHDDYADNQSYDYSTAEMGEENGEFVNLHTGLATVRHTDVVGEGAPVCAEIAHYYDSVTRSTLPSDHNSHCGKGWKLSVCQKIERSDTEEYLEYVYTDAVGKKHYFVDNGNGKLTDTGGLCMTYSGDISSESYITDRSHTKLTFDGLGRLIRVTDQNHNSLDYTYTDDFLTAVTDSFGRVTTLRYSADGLLEEISDPEQRKTYYTYTDGELTEITAPDGGKSRFTYDAAGRMQRVENPDGTLVDYTYVAGKDKIARTDRRTSVERIAHGEVSDLSVAEDGEYKIYEYRSERSTAITDRSGIRHVYVFDENGRTELEYEDSLRNGTQEKGQVTGTAVYRYTNQKRTFASSLTTTDKECVNYIRNGTFENDAPGTLLPAFWTVIRENGCPCAREGVSTTACIDGTRSYAFCEGTGQKYLKQIVEVDTASMIGDTFVLSAWGKAAKAKYGPFTLRADVHYTDNTTETVRAAFDDAYTGWQYSALPLRIQKDKSVDYIAVYADASNCQCDVAFDNIRLVNALGESAVYEENLSETISVFCQKTRIVQRITVHDGIYTTVTDHDSGYMPVRVTTTDLDGNRFVTVSRYDGNHNLVATQDPRGIVTLNQYTAKGQLKKTQRYHSSSFNTADSLVVPDKCFVKEITYDENGEYPVAESDPRSHDIVTGYHYDRNSGLLNAVDDSSGHRTTYVYNPADHAVTSVCSTVGGSPVFVGYGYTKTLLTSLTHNGFDYRFSYDGFGRQTEIRAGDELLASNTYTETDTTTVETTYEGGRKLTVTTDRHQVPVVKTYTENDNTVTLIENEYDEVGKIVKAVDKLENNVYTYNYNSVGSVSEEKRNGQTFKSLSYDKHNRLIKTSVYAADETLEYTPVYETRETEPVSPVCGSCASCGETAKEEKGCGCGNVCHCDHCNGNGNCGNASQPKPPVVYPDNAISGMILKDVFEESTTKDPEGRIVTHKLKTNGKELLEDNLVYLETDRLTDMVEEFVRKVGGVRRDSLRYTYDNNGNITAIFRNVDGEETLQTSYVYDELNQLVRENHFVLGYSRTYQYDTAGNLLCRRKYPVTGGNVVTVLSTDTYRYAQTGWKDKLTEYNGQPITYDGMGNPLCYRGHTLTWERVRLLGSYDSLTFAYNASGMRTRKGNTVYELDGKTILSETANGETIRYYYGNAGAVGFRYHGKRYFYEKNHQGDITAIYDEDGTLKGSYTYDAWGNCTIDTDIDGIATVNPFRYRSYYFDRETGLYYITNRYYDPEVGRWINADSPDTLTVTPENFAQYNLFAYCFNNPANMVDPTGNWPRVSKIFKAVAAVAVAVAVVAITVATCGAAAPALAIAGGSIIGAGAATTAAASVAINAITVAGISTAAAAAAAAAEEKAKKRNHTVYALEDSNGKIQYVGRTTNLEKRKKAHDANPYRKGLKISILASGLNYHEARALEQAGMVYHHTINTANKMNNQINGIAPKYWGIYKEIALGTLNYEWNRMTNEILYWTGN